jgi:dienelactone hydrolase
MTASETLSYEADGIRFKSQLFLPAGSGARAGVLVFPEIFGIGEHAIARAQRLAEAGYAALACDIHGDGQRIPDLMAAIEAMKPLYADTRRMRARGMAGLKALSERPEVDGNRLASIGYCFGGTMSLELARGGAPLRAVVGFHSGLATTASPAAPGTIRPRILVCIGADDPFISPDERRAFETEMRNSGADWQMHLYGGTVHSFTDAKADARGNTAAMRYSASADARSDAAMHTLFAETLA